MRIREKAHVEDQVRIRGNPVAKTETDDRNQQRAAARILKAINNDLAQLMNVESCGVDDDIGEPADRSHSPPLRTNSLGDGAPLAERVRTPRLAEASLKSCVARFDEHKSGGTLAAQLAIDARQLVYLRAFTRVHQQGRALHFAAAVFIEFAEGRNQSDGQIVHAVKAELSSKVFRTERLPDPGQTGKDDELPGVRLPVGARHGEAVTPLPGGGECSGCGGLRDILRRCGG